MSHMRPPRRPSRLCPGCRFGWKRDAWGAWLDGGDARPCIRCGRRPDNAPPLPFAGHVAARAILLGWRAWLWLAPRLDRIERLVWP
jgi:hypothetical protein